MYIHIAAVFSFFSAQIPTMSAASGSVFAVSSLTSPALMTSPAPVATGEVKSGAPKPTDSKHADIDTLTDDLSALTMESDDALRLRARYANQRAAVRNKIPPLDGKSELPTPKGPEIPGAAPSFKNPLCDRCNSRCPDPPQSIACFDSDCPIAWCGRPCVVACGGKHACVALGDPDGELAAWQRHWVMEHCQFPECRGPPPGTRARVLCGIDGCDAHWCSPTCYVKGAGFHALARVFHKTPDPRIHHRTNERISEFAKNLCVSCDMPFPEREPVIACPLMSTCASRWHAVCYEKHYRLHFTDFHKVEALADRDSGIELKFHNLANKIAAERAAIAKPSPPPDKSPSSVAASSATTSTASSLSSSSAGTIRERTVRGFRFDHTSLDGLGAPRAYLGRSSSSSS